jgi:hypothetical protein
MSLDSTNSPAQAPMTQLRVLAATLGGALVVIGVALYFAAGNVDEYPPTWVPATLGVLAVLSFVVSELLGYRANPIAPGTDPETAKRSSVQAFQSGLIMRFAVSEAVAIVAVALTFVVEPVTVQTYLVGMVLSLALFAVHVWPHERAVAKVQAALERDGGTSYLREGLNATPSGAHSETA